MQCTYFSGVEMKISCILAFLALSLLFVACSKEKTKAATPPVAVTVVKAEEREVPLVFESYGLVEPYAQISVKSKLTGKLVKLGFVPGQRLLKGALIAQLDDREYYANLRIYKAQLSKNEILAADAQRILKMKEVLDENNAVPKTELYTQRATA